MADATDGESLRDDLERAALNPGDDSATARFWAEQMDDALLYHKEWHQRGDKIIDRYLDERSEETDREFVRRKQRMNILWSNVQTILPALIARPPVPNVARANRDRDPVGLYAAMTLERCVAAQLRSDEFLASLKAAVLDLLLPGRGMAFVTYEADIAEGERDDLAEGLAPETVEAQRCRIEYIHWKNFYTNRARYWGEMWWQAKETFLDREELRTRYGRELADKIPLDHRPDRDNAGRRIESEQFSKATVWQFWDARSRKVIEIAKDYKTAPLRVMDPPVTFDEFWPGPRPLTSTLAGKSVIPTPDYVQYQDQAEEIDQMTSRIHGLLKCLRLRGVYDASISALATLFNDAGDQELVPVDSYALLSEKGGIEGVMAFVPIKEVAAALMECMRARDDAKKVMYEITGISDIVRGASAASETATAQQLKTDWGSIRIRDRQSDVARFARDIIRHMAQIIGQHWTQKSFAEQSGVKLLTNQEKAALQAWQQMMQRRQQMQQQLAQQPQAPGPAGMAPPPPGSSGPPGAAPPPAAAPNVVPFQLPPPPPPPVAQDRMELAKLPSWEDVIALLRNNTLRSFTVDVETDSTIEPDQNAQREQRTAFVTAVTQFLMAAEKILMPAPMMAPLMGELLLFAVRGWKVGDQMESKIEEAVAMMEKAAQSPKPPDPKIAADQMQAQADMAKTRAEIQKAQMEQQTEQIENAGEMQLKQLDIAADREKARQQANMEQADAAIERGWQSVELAQLNDANRQRAHESDQGERDRQHDRAMADKQRKQESGGE